jgi:hypothetical protein
MHAIERRYEVVGRYIDGIFPPRAVFVGHLHTGSVRYYSGRLTLRYDWVERGWLDTVVRELRARGYAPFILLEEGEEPPFRTRFGAHSRLAMLDWPPVAELREPVRVRIYDPADQARVEAGATVRTQVIDSVRR